MTRPIILDVHDCYSPRFPKPEYCPCCHSRAFVPIIYGFPSEEAAARAREGEFLLGGCMVGEASWYCRNCDHAWPKERQWPTEEERLAYRLRRERHCRRPDVFVQIILGKLRSWCEDLIHRHIRVPLLVRFGGGAVHQKMKLKEGGFRYIVRFPNATVRVHPSSNDASCLEANCLRGTLTGCRANRRYEDAALSLVMRQAP